MIIEKIRKMGNVETFMAPDTNGKISPDVRESHPQPQKKLDFCKKRHSATSQKREKSIKQLIL